MDRNQVKEKLIAIVAKQMAVTPESVIEEMRFAEDLNADSLDIVETVMEIEDQFGLTIPDKEAENLKTIGQAIDYVFGKLQVAA